MAAVCYALEDFVKVFVMPGKFLLHRPEFAFCEGGHEAALIKLKNNRGKTITESMPSYTTDQIHATESATSNN